jgi:hypothetical protein
MSSYEHTLNGLMQQAIEDSKMMNNIQLIILAVEGAFVGMTAVIVIWVFTAKVERLAQLVVECGMLCEHLFGF